MTVLVLGGTGAMGKPIVRKLADSGNSVIVTSRHKQSNEGNIKYLLGDAHDVIFLKTILSERYDAIVDFMVYTPEEFSQRVDTLLEATDHYIFLSSSRVYADSGLVPITELSDRLFDTTDNKEFVKSEEYAMAKAQEENMLLSHRKKNYTIIRPYITYNDNRLQLGIYEKELWLQRALSGKKIVVCNCIMDKITTLTYGDDVAERIACLIGKEQVKGEVFHITAGTPIKWADVLALYLDVLEEHVGKRPEVVYINNLDSLSEEEHYYQMHYDRMYNRIFDNSKINKVLGESRDCIEPIEGLRMCLENFLEGEQKFIYKRWRQEAVFDRLTGEKEKLRNIPGLVDKMRYIAYRYLI